MYTKSYGTLIMFYYGGQHSPCPDPSVAVCTAWGVIGSANLSYTPYVNPQNGPLPTEHLAATHIGEDSTCVGQIAREAYAREHLPTIWRANVSPGERTRRCSDDGIWP